MRLAELGWYFVAVLQSTSEVLAAEVHPSHPDHHD